MTKDELQLRIFKNKVRRLAHKFQKYPDQITREEKAFLEALIAGKQQLEREKK